jgi:hypothetical protein
MKKFNNNRTKLNIATMTISCTSWAGLARQYLSCLPNLNSLDNWSRKD